MSQESIRIPHQKTIQAHRRVGGLSGFARFGIFGQADGIAWEVQMRVLTKAFSKVKLMLTLSEQSCSQLVCVFFIREKQWCG